MCRHFAWVGAPRTLHALFFEPSYGLPEQARLPRWQQIGLVNKDGFGAGWHPPGGGTRVFRTTTPIWEDAEFPAFAREVSAGCVLGAARAASPGMPIEETANAPFTDGEILLSLNGHLNVGKTGVLLEAGREPESTCDSAFLAALLWQRLEQGRPLAETVEGLLYDVVGLDPNACLNMLATDGTQAVATTWAETLCYRQESDGVMVASEPQDDADDWTTVPDRSILVADGSSAQVRSLRTVPSAAPTVLPGEAVPG
ncbi:class II glutamine amidotransferase domain-containing protein [Actinomadura macrotermitis]|uniref:Gamma-glutamyl-hercynylcysteine sulfoxide hydrolase n=1 Tax=Actinomadura macrotermitis TaxID=2585200 RepID=A0A7K0BVB1_9ACTN|nr:class II glutamine amidotransferase [Actinomadura macrotermitis]MQY05006.1 Gamma-glutamyl-hercynylcysteine sulfoxide hydrolase [Actinomadura macrotermitis]